MQVEKKFNIHGESGEVLYTAKESSNCLGRFCCGSIRTLDINVFDQTGRNVSQLTRPLNCAGWCCNICYPVCTQAISVSINGESVGKIEIIFKTNQWYPKFLPRQSPSTPLNLFNVGPTYVRHLFDHLLWAISVSIYTHKC